MFESRAMFELIEEPLGSSVVAWIRRDGREIAIVTAACETTLEELKEIVRALNDAVLADNSALTD